MWEKERRIRFQLRLDFLSSALGVVWAFIVLLITLIAIAGGGRNLVTDFFYAIYPGYSLSILGAILGFIWGYLHGFLQGYLVAWLYKYWLNRDDIDLIFPDLVKQNWAVLQEGRGQNPYTIVFVANPMILKYSENENDRNCEKDPIMDDKAWFSITVRRCIRSIYRNELFGIKEFISSYRIIAIFDSDFKVDNMSAAEQKTHALCEEYNLDELLAPRKRLFVSAPDEFEDISKNYVARFWPRIYSGSTGSDAIDIIFAISGSPTHIRSAARFSKEPEVVKPLKSKKNTDNGVFFNFKFRKNAATWDAFHDKKLHAFYADLPGIVALSALEDRPKTTIHELAHAIGSPENGFIDDEYYDGGQRGAPFRINKKTRTPYKLSKNALGVGVTKGPLLLELEDIRDELNDAGLPSINPTDIKSKLQAIVDQSESGDSDFLYKVMEECGPDNIQYYGRSILRHADQTKYQVTEPALTGLKRDLVRRSVMDLPDDDDYVNHINSISAIITKLRRISGNTPGRIIFRTKLVAEFGATDTALYEDLIYKHMKAGVETIPQYFTTYKFNNETREYYSNRSRPNAQRNWSSYVPAALSPLVSCTMDRVFYSYKFDKVIFDLMYDRLITKINRL
ncbi:MAG: hypothetical protein DWQ05_23020 [Calditrichaeota bacterium]|nr:MAG: hypothetical protein DWQ05_23020 [Calditrichota bacterium]